MRRSGLRPRFRGFRQAAGPSGASCGRTRHQIPLSGTERRGGLQPGGRGPDGYGAGRFGDARGGAKAHEGLAPEQKKRHQKSDGQLGAGGAKAQSMVEYPYVEYDMTVSEAVQSINNMQPKLYQHFGLEEDDVENDAFSKKIR